MRSTISLFVKTNAQTKRKMGGGRAGHIPHLAKLHPKAALVPPSDDTPCASRVREGLLALVLGAPELLAGVLLLCVCFFESGLGVDQKTLWILLSFISDFV